jgi:recombination protein RecA
MNAGKTAHAAETGRADGIGEGSGSRVRAFVAIELPEHIIAVLGRFQEELKALGLSLRWTRPENIHLTLKFLGDMPESGLSGICDAVGETARAHGPITLAAKGIGVFPNIRRPNVLWTGIAGQTEILTVLQRDLDARLHDLLGTAPGKKTIHRASDIGKGQGAAGSETVDPRHGNIRQPGNGVVYSRRGLSLQQQAYGFRAGIYANHESITCIRRRLNSMDMSRTANDNDHDAIQNRKSSKPKRRGHMSKSADKERAVEAAITQIERQFGKGSIMKLGGDAIVQVPVIPTGSIALDHALGIGGIPRGRVTEIYGPESSGKTTLALHVVAEAQRQGGIAAFVDAEHALDTAYARKLGVNCDELLVAQPDTGEQALEIAEMLVRSGAIDVLVIDSVAALVPRAEIEGDMGDSHMGLQARLMSQALRKLTGTISKTMTSVIFINQIRMKIGVVFGNPETTTGGNALKFYATVRIEIRRTGAIKDGQETTGNRTKAKVVKNKMAPPFKEAEFDIMYGEGISVTGDLIDKGVEANVVEKSGSWYSYNGERIGQGRENAKSFLKQNPEIQDRLLKQVKEAMGMAAVNPAKGSGELKVEAE